MLVSGGLVLAVKMLLTGMAGTKPKRERHSTCTYHYFIEKLITSMPEVCFNQILLEFSLFLFP